MTSNICQVVQENIASGEGLTDRHLNHLGACEKCTRVLDDYHKLEALFTLQLNSTVMPADFVDNVMSCVDDDAPGVIDRFAGLRPAWQWVLLGVGVLISISSVFQFIFFLLMPAY